jgi:hypothetical protein
MDADLNDMRMKMLGEFAELALSLARDLHKDATAAEDPAEKVRLADAFHQMGRGMRQSLALHARMEREAKQAEADPQPPGERREKRLRRRAEVKAAIERLIWTEREKLDAEPYVLRARLNALLTNEAETEAFPDEDPQAVIARIAEMLGISVPPPEGEVSPKVTEGVEAHSRPNRPAPQPPLSLRDSSPSGGASGDPPFPSSA